MAVEQAKPQGNVPVRDASLKTHLDQSLHQVLYDAVGQLSPDLSEEAFSTLCDDARSSELNPLTLNFRQKGEIVACDTARSGSNHALV